MCLNRGPEHLHLKIKSIFEMLSEAISLDRLQRSFQEPIFAMINSFSDDDVRVEDINSYAKVLVLTDEERVFLGPDVCNELKLKQVCL